MFWVCGAAKIVSSGSSGEGECMVGDVFSGEEILEGAKA